MRHYHFKTGNTLVGYEGKDHLISVGNNTVINGVGGNDHLWSIGNSNTLDGGNGNDHLSSIGSDNVLSGGSGDDVLKVIGKDNQLQGGDGDDHLIVIGSNNVLDGNAGNDRLFAGFGNDTAHYSYEENIEAKDFYHGGNGSDTLILNFSIDTVHNFIADEELTDVADWMASLNDYINHSKSGNINFAAFGFDLKAVSFENIQINIEGVDNKKVILTDDVFSTTEDSDALRLNILSNDTLPDDYAITGVNINGQFINVGDFVTLDSGASVGVNADGTFSYYVNDGFSALAEGEAYQDTWHYAFSSLDDAQKATVTMSVLGDNDKSIAGNDYFTGNETDVISGNILLNDTDVDDNFSIYTINGQRFESDNTYTLISGAIVSVNADGTFNYDANGQFESLLDGSIIQDSFSYQLIDEAGAISNVATTTIDVQGVETPDDFPRFVISDASTIEGDKGQQFLTFEVSLTKPSGGMVSVDYATGGGNASGIISADYTAQNGTLHFAVGETSKTIAIAVNGDNQFESDEMMQVKLFNSSGPAILDGAGVGTIVNDDAISTGSLAPPVLNSNQDAQHVIYLDFNGNTLTSGNAWTDFFGLSEINSPAYDTDGDTLSFSAEELNAIKEIWARVAEDFLPFNVNITTDESVYLATNEAHRVSVVITDDYSWFGNAEGATFDGFYGSDEYFQPIFVFSNHDNNDSPMNIANEIANQVGYHLGLSSDGQSSDSTYNGQGTGETAWTPIMGENNDNELTQWSNGEYSNATNTEDDLSIIASYFDYREDDHGDTIADASVMYLAEGFSAEGIIETNTDVDLFKFVADSDFIFNITPNEFGPNLDILAKLYDMDGNLLQTSNPEGDLSASISYSVAGETELYLAISGTGDAVTGYSDYGSLGYYSINVA